MRSVWARGCAVSIAVLAVTIGLAVLYLRTSAGRTVRRVQNQDGDVTAEVNMDCSSAATDGCYTGVLLRTRYNPIRHYVFAGLDYGAKITIAWVGPRELLITCQDCSKLSGGNIKERIWRSVTIRYEIS